MTDATLFTLTEESCAGCDRDCGCGCGCRACRQASISANKIQAQTKTPIQNIT